MKYSWYGEGAAVIARGTAHARGAAGFGARTPRAGASGSGRAHAGADASHP